MRCSGSIPSCEIRRAGIFCECASDIAGGLEEKACACWWFDVHRGAGGLADMDCVKAAAGPSGIGERRCADPGRPCKAGLRGEAPERVDWEGAARAGLLMRMVVGRMCTLTTASIGAPMSAGTIDTFTS
jgi:hypothetical protein